MSDKYNLSSKFAWGHTMNDLSETFRSWGVLEWDTNYPKGARLEGFMQSEQDRTVTLKYNKDGKNIVLTMGKQKRAQDNLRVLYLAVESMRLNDKRGIGEVLESAYLQLAAPQSFNPYEFLGIMESMDLEVAEAVYKAKTKKAHPDAGGSEEYMKKLNQAIEMIRKDKNV